MVTVLGSGGSGRQRLAPLALVTALHCLPAPAHAQTLTVVIDTVDTVAPSFGVELDNGYWGGRLLPWDMQTEPGFSVYSRSNFPNYVARFDSIGRATSLLIPLDSDGGVLLLSGLDRFNSDTLHIHAVKVWKRCVRDTTRTTAFKYPILNGELGVPKVEHIVEPGPDPGCTEVPQDMTCKINGKSHHIPVTLKGHSAVTRGHGYEPRGCRDYGKKRKRCTYLYFIGEEQQLVYFAEHSLAQ